MKTFKLFATLICLLSISKTSLAAFNKNSAYISLFSQKTELSIKDTDVFTRIKYEIVFNLMDKKALTLHHNYSIYLSYFEKLEDIEVITKNPQPDGKIKTIKQKDFESSNASSSGVFFDDMQEIKVNFLGLTVGSEVRIEYTVSTREPHFTDPMTFRYYLPIEKVYYELTVPNEIKISFLEKNISNDLPIQKAEQKKKNETVYTWTANEVEEEKSYESAPSRLYYTPHIIYKVDEYEHKGITRGVSKTPADLYKWYANNIKNLNQKPTERIQQLADSITNGATSNREKAKRIYNWVQSNIRYVAFEAGMEGLVPREADAVCSKRYGDCKDMSNLQYGLLRAVNVPAYLVWIGTRKIPYTYTELPLKNTDNHMIAAFKDNDQWIFLDGTDPNCIFGLPADHIQGKQAMIGISPTEFELVMVPVIDAKTNFMKETSKLHLEGNDLFVKSSTAYGGLIAGNLANTLHYMTESEKEDYAKGTIKRVGNNAKLIKHVIPDASDVLKSDFQLEYSVPDFVKEVDNEKYINIFLDRLFMNDAIKEENRKVPFGFSLNLASGTNYELEIPKDYKVSYVPKDASFSEKQFGFSVKYRTEGGKLFCDFNTYSDFPNLIMDASQFPQWDQFVKQLNGAYKESIILEKIK